MTRPERLAALLLYLQSRRGDKSRATAGEIAAHFGVSRRTVLRDVAALAEIGVPVESTDGAAGGYALPSDYPLAPLPLSAPEVLLLLFALNGIEKLTVAPFGDARETLAAKLRALLSPSHRALAETWRDKLSVDVPERPGQQAPFLDLLLSAIPRSGWIAARYRSEAGGEAAHTLLPRQITTGGGFWYCRAWSHERGAERTFRVDRFVSAEPTAPPPDAHPDASDTIPYDHPDHPLIDVRLTAYGVSVAEREQHVGRLVERDDADGSGTLCFRCPPSELPYWSRYFFRLGDDATVLGPPELRAGLRSLAEKILAAHPEP